MLVMLMLAGVGEVLSLKPVPQRNADVVPPGLMLAQVAPALKTSVQLPAPVSVHAAVVLPGVCVHVADGGVPSPEHAAAHVAPSELLRQPAIHTALLMGRLVAVGTSGQVTAGKGKEEQ
jgi:hypothetical protein